MTECSDKKEQEDILKMSENGENEKVKLFFENNNPEKLVIDNAIRKCLNKFRSNKINYCETIKELFKHADLNFCNPEKKNQNILMAICPKCDIFLLDLLFNQKITDNYDNKNKINTNNNDNSLYIEIDIYKVDINNNNVFHHLFNNNIVEYEITVIITKIMHYKANNNKLYSIDKKKYLFTQPNNEGITPIVIVLRKGWFNSLCLIFKYIDYQKYIIPNNNNNLIHCAIEGKNIKCIKKILSYCKSRDELKFKNKEGYTPLSYANKYNLYLIGKIIEETDKNFDDEDFKNIILSIKEENVYYILEKYMNIQNNNYINNNFEDINSITNKEYNSILNYLYKYKINQYILCKDNINLPCEWNILFIKIQLSQLINYDNNNNINKGNPFSYLKEISHFFGKKLINNYIKEESKDIYYNVDIIFYNKILYHYKICDYFSLFTTVNYYFNNIYQQNNNDNNYYKYITFVNITFILIEYFIFDNHEKISGLLLEQLEKYLFANYPNKKNFNENNLIIKYLNNNEIYNPFNPTWDDAFCYLYLLKSLYHIKYYKNIILNNNNDEEQFNEFKKNLREFKKTYNNCNYKEELLNFNRLLGLYTINKCYYYYLTNNHNKSLYKISLIKQSLYEYSNEHKIFYFNSLGIINLKLKKFKSSEYFFKLGINLFKSINNNPNDDILFYRMEYLIKMKYNLCLALFYNKKYNEIYQIYNEIKNFIIIKNNPFFWYRYGLTSLNLYLKLLKKINEENKKEKKNIYFNYFKKESKNNNNDNIYKDKNSNKDELYIEFEKEYGNNDLNIQYSYLKNRILFIDLGLNKNELYNKINQKINIKKKNNKIIDYLSISITCFKRAIMLLKRPSLTIKREKKIFNGIKSILEFYTKNENSEQRKLINDIITNEYESSNNLEDSNMAEKSLFISCYMNLLFCLSLNEKYNEILFLIKSFPPNLKRNNINIINKLNYFKLNAMLNLNKYKEVENIIEDNKLKTDENQNINYTTYEFDCYDYNNCRIEKNVNHKIYLLLSEIILDCKLKRYENAEKNLIILIGQNDFKNNIISKYYYQLMIYILSIQNKRSKTINFIKYSWNQIQNKYKNDIQINNNDKNG